MMRSKRIHPIFPTLDEVEDDPSLVYSDHVPIFAEVDLNKNSALRMLSLNVLGPSAFSGLHDKTGWEDEDGLQLRYQRIATFLKKAQVKHNLDVILLQEANDRFISEPLKQALGENWKVVAGSSDVISCYRKTRFELHGHTENKETRTLSLFLEDKKNKNKIIAVHNVWTAYSPFPKETEDLYRTLLTANYENAIAAFVMGDTNSRIAPLDDELRNITTGAIPVFFNERNGYPEHTQIPDHPDGGFYQMQEGGDKDIYQLETHTLDFVTAKIVKGERSTRDFDFWPEYRMILCLDDRANRANFDIFSYEAEIKTQLYDDQILVRMAANVFNEKKLALRFSCNANVYRLLTEELREEEEFEFRNIREDNLDKNFSCLFLPLDKVELLKEKINIAANIETIRHEFSGALQTQIIEVNKSHCYLRAMPEKAAILNAVLTQILQAPVLAEDNPRDYFREMLMEWENEKKYSDRKSGRSFTNKEMLSHHRNILFPRKRKALTATEEALETLKRDLPKLG